MIHFIAKRPRACCMLMVKVIGGTQGKSKPYVTIERADFSNAIVFDNLVQKEITECEHQYGHENYAKCEF